MATQKGIVPIKGTLGGITFYSYKGKPVARMAGGGFTSKAIKTSPSMVRVRESNSEFGQCSRIKKVFRNALSPYFESRTDATLHGRMMRLFLDVKDCDLLSVRGQRHVRAGLLTTRGKQLMQDFAFTSMPMPGMTWEYDTVQSALTITHLDAGSLSFPHGATHLTIDFGVLVLDSDPSAATLFRSEAIVLERGATPAPFTLSPIDPVSGSGTRFSVLHCSYLQEVNGALYPLKSNETFGVWILEVYGE